MAPAAAARLRPRSNIHISANNNVDPRVARGFGREWSTFRQDTDHLSQQWRQVIFDDYFCIFPWHLLPPGVGMSFYADKSFNVMRTDAYDRFCTRLCRRHQIGHKV